MYGIVNKAIEELVTENFGAKAWEDVKKESGIDIDYFLSNEPYDDAITYQLAIAASKTLDMPLDNVLIAFGEFWVLNTGKKKYGALMQAGGSNLKEFLINLPNFHARVSLIYPKLAPPEFKVTDIEENGLHLHYFSHRPGLKEFVRGLIQGLGKMYEVAVNIDILQSRDEGSTHEVYAISW
ncbi:MAG: heme NO-binding domain-containing protein [Saprospiraceae bacterium]|nr:heme NO-binding domain-containing protein [Saprospiraceae bacterium]